MIWKEEFTVSTPNDEFQDAVVEDLKDFQRRLRRVSILVGITFLIVTAALAMNLYYRSQLEQRITTLENPR